VPGRWFPSLIALLGACHAPTAALAQQIRLLPLTARVNSRVRVVETGPDSSWRYGMLNRFRFEPPCFLIMLFGPEMRLTREIPLHAVRRLQLSTRFDGSHGPVPWADTITVPGEEWWDVPSDTIRAAVDTCATRRSGDPSRLPGDNPERSREPAGHLGWHPARSVRVARPTPLR
jgi:hypothetical protein